MIIAKQVRLGPVDENMVKEIMRDLAAIVSRWPLVVEREEIDRNVYRLRFSVSSFFEYMEDYYVVKFEGEAIKGVGGEGVFILYVDRDGDDTVLRIVYQGYSRRIAEKLVKEILVSTYKYVVSMLRELATTEDKAEEKRNEAGEQGGGAEESNSLSPVSVLA